MATVAEINAQNAALIKQIEAGTAKPTTTKDSSNAFSQLSSDVSFFLKMLTTQLKNQDPTQPFDTQQMSQQIAQYSGVEQQVKTNSNLEKLIANFGQSQVASAVSYINQEVEYEGNSGQVLGGQGAFSYTLPSAAKTAEIVIKDKAGTTVFQGQGTTNAGRNIVVWDGMNSATGKQMPDGMYTLSVTALDDASKPITPTIKSVGIVSGVETASDGSLLLNIGTTQLALSKVQVVRTPNRVVAAAEGNTSGT